MPIVIIFQNTFGWLVFGTPFVLACPIKSYGRRRSRVRLNFYERRLERDFEIGGALFQASIFTSTVRGKTW